MCDRPQSGSSRPEVSADDGSVCNNRKITLGHVKGSLTFRDEAEGKNPSGNVGQQVPSGRITATGGSCVNADQISAGNVDGDVNFSTKASCEQDIDLR